MNRIIENDILFKVEQDWRGRGRGEIIQYVLLKWTMCFLLGLTVGAIGFFNNLAVENISGVKFVITSDLMLSRESVTSLTLHLFLFKLQWSDDNYGCCRYGLAFTVFTAANFVLVMTASMITCFFAPAAAGSGIPEVKAYLNGVDAPNILSFRTLVVKVFSSQQDP